MEKIIIKMTSLVLSIVTLAVLLSVLTIPVSATPPAPHGNVGDRIQQLRQLFPHNSFFSDNGNECSHTAFFTCNHCRLSNVMISLGYSGLQGNSDAWTCAAFSRFAYFYVFGQPWNALVTTNATEISLANALPGDIFRWGTPHYGMNLGNSRFYHSNSGTGTNRVSYDTTFNGTLTNIWRSNNFNQINNLGTSFATAIPMLSGTNRHVSVTTTHPMRFYSFTPTQSRTYTIESFNNGLSDPFGWIFNDSQTLLAQDDNSGGNRNFRIEMHLVSGRRYFIRAGCFQNGTGNYQIRIF